MSAYPNRLGVFPLTDVVLFPHAHLPVHVADTRHHALVADALRRDGRLVLAALRSRDERFVRAPVYPTACAGYIVRHQRLNDDVSNVIVRGERVVHLREVERWEPFRVAHFDALEPERLAVRRNTRERVEEIRRLIERCCPGAFEKLAPSLYHAPEDDGGLELLNTIASSLPVGVERKLSWLDCDGPEKRWRELRDVLQRMGDERETRSRVIARYEDLRPGRPDHN